MNGAEWSVAEGRARLVLPRLAASVDLAEPGRGLFALEIDGQPGGEMSALGVELPRVEVCDRRAVPDCYVRADDLVATYADRPAISLRTVVYWHAGPGAIRGTIGIVELRLSVQTSLLDSRPRVVTRTRLPAGEALRLGDPQRGLFSPAVFDQTDDARPVCFLFRPASRPFSYAEMVHPADLAVSEPGTGLQSSADQQSLGAGHVLRHAFFSQPLEKGVMLRARAVGVWLERDLDAECAASHYAALLAAPLPLSA